MSAPLTELPLDAAGKRSSFFEKGGVDELVTMVLELATELWVVRERLFALESIACLKGQLAPADMESWQPSEAEREQLAAMRGSFLSSLFRTINPSAAIRPVSGGATPEPTPSS